MEKKYKVTRKFINGTLKGLTYTEIADLPIPVGFTVKKPYGNTSGYKIIECEEVN